MDNIIYQFTYKPKPTSHKNAERPAVFFEGVCHIRIPRENGHAPRSRRQLNGLGQGALECGGKRSATPLWLGQRQALLGAPGGRNPDSPSPLRSAGALQGATLSTVLAKAESGIFSFCGRELPAILRGKSNCWTELPA